MVHRPLDRAEAVALLARAGCVAAPEEADVLFSEAGGGAGAIDDLLARRLDGEPLAWVVGWVGFCGVRVGVDHGVFVPRPHTEPLARRAVSLLPEDGTAVDLCTGSGAIAVALASARPRATVVGTEIDPIAAACAVRNGVRVLVGDLDEPMPSTLRGSVDVITAVVPYVPAEELHLLPRDVLAHEPRHALDGGPRGTSMLLRLAEAASWWLRPGGSLLLELGGDQADDVTAALERLGFGGLRVHRDDDGQTRAVEARFEGPMSSGPRRSRTDGGRGAHRIDEEAR